MIRAARSIWDTRIQCVCGVIAAQEGPHREVFMCANFGQVSLDPPRIIINPNRVYPIDGMIRRTRRFTLSLMSEAHRAAVLRLIKLRRRQPRKAELAGLTLAEDSGQIPWIADAIAVLFCDVEQILETGDHTVMIAAVRERRESPAPRSTTPLLYRDVAGLQTERNGAGRRLRRLLVGSGIPDLVRGAVARLRPPAPADLPGNTYREGGYTEAEIARLLQRDVWDRGRTIEAPRPAPPVRRRVGVCVVGTHWGESQAAAVRGASGQARLFVCGRDPVRTARLAGIVKAEGHFIGLDAALADTRVEAVVLAVPHHLHRESAERALAAGKAVLVEKPIASNLADAAAMLATARRFGDRLMVAENMHFRPSVGMVARRIAAGDAGEPLHMLVHAGAVRKPESWVADKEKLGGGVFVDIGIHYVRALRLLMGEPDTAVAFQPMQLNTRMGGEDGLQVIFRSEVGWQSHFLTTWSGGLGRIPDIVIVGDAGTFHLWPMAGYYDYYPVAPRPLVRMLSYVRPYWLQARLIRPTMQRERVTFGGSDDGYVEQMREFLSAVENGRPFVTPPEDGYRDLEIVTCCYESLERGQPVKIPPQSLTPSRA